MLILGIIILSTGLMVAYTSQREVLSKFTNDILEVVSVLCVLGGMVVVIMSLNDKLDILTNQTPTHNPSYSESEQSHCSLLAHSCIVNEWSPICLIKKCVIDARSEE